MKTGNNAVLERNRQSTIDYFISDNNIYFSAKITHLTLDEILTKYQIGKEKAEFQSLIPQDKIRELLDEIDEYFTDELGELWDAVSFVDDLYKLDDLRLNTEKRKSLGSINEAVYEMNFDYINIFFQPKRLDKITKYKQVIEQAKQDCWLMAS